MGLGLRRRGTRKAETDHKDAARTIDSQDRQHGTGGHQETVQGVHQMRHVALCQRHEKGLLLR